MKALIALALLPLFFGVAHAEQTTIDVPFKIADTLCNNFQDANTGLRVMTCHFFDSSHDHEELNLIPDERVNHAPTVTITVETIPQEKDIVVLTPEEKQLQAIANTIEKLSAKSDLSKAEQKAIATLRSLDFCSRGYEDTAPIQSPTQFVIPNDILSLQDGKWIIDLPNLDNTNFKIRGGGIYGDMAMAAQECKGQIILQGKVTPDHYRFKLTDEIQPYHADRYIGKSAMPQALPATQLGEANKSIDLICRSDYYTIGFKYDYGCEIDFGVDTVPRPTTQIRLGDNPLDRLTQYNLVCGKDIQFDLTEEQYADLLDLAQTYPCNIENSPREAYIRTLGNYQ